MKLINEYILVRMLERISSSIVLLENGEQENTMVGEILGACEGSSCLEGQFVRFVPYSGFEFNHAGKKCRLIRERDIILIHGQEFERGRYRFEDERKEPHP